MQSTAEITARIEAALARRGVRRGELLAVALAPGIGIGLATTDGWSVVESVTDPMEVVRQVEARVRPRWVVWDSDTVAPLVASGVRLATCWHIAAAQRLLVGGWRTSPARAWADLNGLSLDDVPVSTSPDLFTVDDDDQPDEPVGVDGHVKAQWSSGEVEWTAARLGRWAVLAGRVAELQQARLSALTEAPTAPATARAESAAELLCIELSTDGLPMDRHVAEEIVGASIGPRPRSDAEAVERRRARDDEVLRHAPGGHWDLRNPAQVKSMLRSVGLELPDTRARRLEALRDAHPLVDALLEWRKAERIATTFGYGWLDANLGSDGRLRGEWSGCDGAAGRMTASAGLHNMPSQLRPAVIAEAGHVFVRADLGQIEPRILAAVSGDPALATATAADDMYLPVAERLGVDRATAKVAVLGAMYGQTTGHGATALRELERAYPVAMRYLGEADVAGQVGRDRRTYGGRLVRFGPVGDDDAAGDGRSRAAARGRYGRNAMVQGAAAEFFKVWAVTIRARGGPLGATVVLCLHDEVLIHTPERHGEEIAALVLDCLDEAAERWARGSPVRFVADVTVVRRWSDVDAP